MGSLPRRAAAWLLQETWCETAELERLFEEEAQRRCPGCAVFFDRAPSGRAGGVAIVLLREEEWGRWGGAVGRLSAAAERSGRVPRVGRQSGRGALHAGERVCGIRGHGWRRRQAATAVLAGAGGRCMGRGA